MMKMPAAQYAIEDLKNWEGYVDKMTSLVAEAKNNEADLLLLPEYAGVEMVGYRDTDELLYQDMQDLLKSYHGLFAQLAKQYGIYIQPGTVLERMKSKQYRNRAYFFTPDGCAGFQDKLHLIEYEKQTGLFEAGDEQTVFDTKFGKVGIAVCYDSEFPEVVRKLTYAGAELILVPSYTVTSAGYHRVFLSARARAIENQCYVAVSFVVGEVKLSQESESTVGQAAVLGPADVGFPDDGILAQGEMNQPALVYADLSFKRIASVRRLGQVRNFEDGLGAKR